MRISAVMSKWNMRVTPTSLQTTFKGDSLTYILLGRERERDALIETFLAVNKCNIPVGIWSLLCPVDASNIQPAYRGTTLSHWDWLQSSGLVGSTISCQWETFLEFSTEFCISNRGFVSWVTRYEIIRDSLIISSYLYRLMISLTIL